MKITFPLLPNYFKIIAILLATAGVGIFLLQTSGYSQMLSIDDDFLISVSLIIAAMAIAAFTAEKIEDDSISYLRAVLMQNAFMTAALFTISQPIIYYLIGTPEILVSAHYIMFIALSLYLVRFTLAKKSVPAARE